MPDTLSAYTINISPFRTGALTSRYSKILSPPTDSQNLSLFVEFLHVRPKICGYERKIGRMGRGKPLLGLFISVQRKLS